MFGFGNVSIRTAKNNVEDMIRLQDSVIKDVKAEQDRLTTSRNRASRGITTALQTIVSGEMSRYSELSNVSEAAGANNNFLATVEQWMSEDTHNRASRAALVAEHGERNAIGTEIVALKENLDISKSANQEVGNEITAWDDTAKAIEKYNTTYPTNQITQENHDAFEKFSFINWMRRYTLGLVFNSQAAPHEAHKIMGAYDKEYGDYYEDALNIFTLRKAHEDILVKQEEQQVRYDLLNGVASKIDSLDSTYKGPEKIRSLISDQVYDLVKGSKNFCKALLSAFSNDETTLQAVTASARMKGLDNLKPSLDQMAQEANETKREFNEPLNILEKGNRMIPNEHINFDFSSVERKFDDAREEFSSSLDNVKSYREAIERYEPVSHDVDVMFQEIETMSTVDETVTDRTFDFSDLERDVKHEISQEEARLAKIERQRQKAAQEAREAAREQQEALNKMLKASRERRSPNIGGGGIARAQRTQRSPSIGGGSIAKASNTRRR